MKNIRKSKPFFLSVSALLVLLNLGYASKTPAFKSKLFESGNLLISDDFDQEKYKGRYGPNKKNVKQLADGTLEVLPLSGTPGDLTVLIDPFLRDAFIGSTLTSFTCLFD